MDGLRRERAWRELDACPLGEVGRVKNWWETMAVETSTKEVTILRHDGPPVIVKDAEWPSVGRVNCGETWMEARQNTRDPNRWLVYGMVSLRGQIVHVGKHAEIGDYNIRIDTLFHQIANALGHTHLAIELLQALPPVRM